MLWFDLLVDEGCNNLSGFPFIPLQGHKRGSSYNSVCAFVQPESSLETSLVRHSSQVHANPISMSLRGGGGAVGGASHKGSEISSASFASQNSVEGYVDTVVDDQYVVIEASPSGSGSSSQSSQPVRRDEGGKGKGEGEGGGRGGRGKGRR